MITQKPLGTNGPLTGRLGYGAMVLEGYYGESDDEQAVATLVRAINSGMMLDSADAYGSGHNELLIGEALKRPLAAAPFIATKFGIVFDESQSSTEVPTGWGFSLGINATPEYARRALDNSLERLGTDCIDLWYVHYPDPSTPMESTVEAMAEAVDRGKVKHIGLSNVTAEQVRRAHAVHPVAAVQYEYSLWRREAETDLLPTLRELGIALVGWSPLGGGFLTGTVDQVSEQDFRQHNPRYSGENLSHNRDRFTPLNTIARELDIQPAQLALSWLLHQGEDIFPIPGTRSIPHLEQNIEALDVHLSAEALDRINEIAAIGSARGSTLL